MGIQGLLPFLKKIHTPVNISQFKGLTVAIDAYCWLHKGAFSCADKLALGEKTEQYVYYCMKYVDCLLRNGVTPILVFDGCHLPSKKDVEKSRRERREVNRKRAAQLLREGKRTEARECLQRCIDISPQMALELMNVCRDRGVDCIVAPYEADAQLAYLNKAGIAQIIITEDSDLLLFGCEKVIFKMDIYGNGVLIEQSRLNEVVDIQDGFYTFDKFRYMCILSGCDYLPSLPGIGLAKACKLFKMARQSDIRQLLKKLPSYLKMNLVVSEDYIDGFIRADNTFLYQLIFDPLTRKLCPLTPYVPEVELEELRYAGPYFSDHLALQIALGNIDIHTREKFSNFDPDTFTPKHAKKQEMVKGVTCSIWKRGYRPRQKTCREFGAGEEEGAKCGEGKEEGANRLSLVGMEVQLKNTLPKRSPVKRVRQADDSAAANTDTELTDLYSASKRKRSDPGDKVSPLNDGTKDRSLLQCDEDEEVKSEQLNAKQVLSPSKSCNQRYSKSLTTNKAFSLMEQELAVETTEEEKENGKDRLTTKRNKFALSALSKKAKFSLNAPSLPNVKVEVKSRYFGSTSTSTENPAAQGNDGDTVKTSGIKQSLTVAESHSAQDSAAHQSDLEVPCSSTGEESALTPKVLSKDASVLSKFRSDSDKYRKNNNEPETTTCSVKVPSKSESRVKKICSSSPSSAFSWASFKFSKSNSAPSFSSSPVSGNSNSNKPFKRVLSENKTETGSQHSLHLHDSDETQLELFNTPHRVTPESELSSPNNSQGDGDKASEISWSQRSTTDTEASQRSNLYSIDSDCFPGSQDLVDLTDCADNSQPLDGGDIECLSMPVSVTQTPQSLKSPSIPRSNSGAGTRKCRVSGLSRGKKKSPPGLDVKQQKIRDMFSRFAHQKSCKEDQPPAASREKWSEQTADTGSRTPSQSLFPHPTYSQRKLLI